MDLYLVDPVVGEGNGVPIGAGIAAGAIGGPVGLLVEVAIVGITDASVEDVVVAYPSAPSAETWFPDKDAYPRSES